MRWSISEVSKGSNSIEGVVLMFGVVLAFAIVAVLAFTIVVVVAVGIGAYREAVFGSQLMRWSMSEVSNGSKAGAGLSTVGVAKGAVESWLWWTWSSCVNTWRKGCDATWPSVLGLRGVLSRREPAIIRLVGVGQRG